MRLVELAITSLSNRCGAASAKVLADHAAHREADEMRVLDLQRIEQAEDIGASCSKL
jgi:hypothetical protein